MGWSGPGRLEHVILENMLSHEKQNVSLEMYTKLLDMFNHLQLAVVEFLIALINKMIRSTAEGLCLCYER